MNLNTRSVFALVAAFAAGALVFAPLRSYAGSPAADEQGTIAWQPTTSGAGELFVVKNGARISLYRVDFTKGNYKMTLQDKQLVP